VDALDRYNLYMGFCYGRLSAISRLEFVKQSRQLILPHAEAETQIAKQNGISCILSNPALHIIAPSVAASRLRDKDRAYHHYPAKCRSVSPTKASGQDTHLPGVSAQEKPGADPCPGLSHGQPCDPPRRFKRPF
jgi:hypothetical protein